MFSDNQIYKVNPDYFEGVTNLQQLYLEDNNISIFPDLGGSKPSIQWLYLFDNPITEAPLNAFLDYQSLTSFHLQGNLMECFPNTCDVDFWNRLVGLAWGLGNMNCDCRILHIFTARNWTEEMHFNNFWQCQKPQLLIGTAYDVGLKMEDLICNGETFR